MWALVLLMFVILLLGIVTKYTHILTVKQGRFLVWSSILYVIVLVLFKGVLLSSGDVSGKNLQHLVTNNASLFPLFFFIAWFFVSAAISNAVSGRQDYQGFWSTRDLSISERQEMPQ
jgi:hypothetical protein